MTRIIVLDIETTGLYTQEGHRLLEVTALEMKNNKITGVEFNAMVNPERDIPAEVTKIHGITNERVVGKPLFVGIARELKEFIGTSPIIITCRTKDGYTLDIAFMNMEMEEAGFSPFPEAQFVNVRRWSEAMFGNDKATLDKVLDRYKIDRSIRDLDGHSSALDARLLAAAYPKLLEDYTSFVTKQKSAEPASKITPPTP